MNRQQRAERTVNELAEKGSFNKWLGIEVKKVSAGHVTMEMTVRKDMLNGLGVAHGGIIFSLADTALGFASNSHGKVCMAIENNISYLQKVEAGDTLTATTEELSCGRRMAVYQVTILRNDAEKVAVFRGTVYRTETSHSLD